MYKCKSKILAFLVTVTLVFSILPGRQVNADCSGDTGSLFWKLDDGTLTISGEGEMADYTDSYPAPWYSERNQIKTVVIGEGATRIGTHCFRKCLLLERIDIPESIEKIRSHAFEGCTSLTNVDIPYGVRSIESYAFEGCNSLESITIPDSVTSIGHPS